MTDMISVEEARDLVLSRVEKLDTVVVPLLEAAGRVAAADLTSDIDVSSFANAAMDGYALHAEDIAAAGQDAPVEP